MTIYLLFIIDAHGPKIPMLLACGHDMCRNCIKYLYRKNKRVICKVCQTDIMYEHFYFTQC